MDYIKANSSSSNENLNERTEKTISLIKVLFPAEPNIHTYEAEKSTISIVDNIVKFTDRNNKEHTIVNAPVDIIWNYRSEIV